MPVKDRKPTSETRKALAALNALKHGRYATTTPIPVPEVDLDRFDQSLSRFNDEFGRREQVDASLFVTAMQAWHERELANLDFMVDLRAHCLALRGIDFDASARDLELALENTTRFLETSLRRLSRDSRLLQDALYLLRRSQQQAIREKYGRMQAERRERRQRQRKGAQLQEAA